MRRMRGGAGVLLAIALARVGLGYQMQTVASLGPELMQTFGFGLGVLGTLIGVYMLPGMAVALPCGFLARRFGDRDTMAAGLGLMVAGGVVSALGGGAWGIGAGRLVAGTGAVALTVLQGKILADLWRGTRFDLAMGFSVGAFPIGIGVAQLTQGPLARTWGWPAAFLAGSAIAAAALMLFLASFRGPPRGAGGRVMGRMMVWPSRHETWLVILAGLVWTTYNAGYFNFLAYMPTALAERGHPGWVADLVMSIATWGNLPAILLGGAIAARLGATRVFVFATVLGVVAVIGMGVADWPLLWGTLFGTLASLHAGLIVGVGTLAARPENRAVGMGLFYTTYYVGGGLTPAICGAAAEWSGSTSGAFLAAGVLAALAWPLWVLQRRGAAA